MNKYTLPFNLAEAQRGAEFGTVSGSRCEFIAYNPQRRKGFRVIVRDIKSDHLYSHAEDGTHNHSTQRDLFMAASEPAATKSVAQETNNTLQNAFNARIEGRVAALEREVWLKPERAPAAKVVRWLAVWQTPYGLSVWQTPYGLYSSCVLFSTEQNAYDRAVLACNSPRNSNPRAIRVEL